MKAKLLACVLLVAGWAPACYADPHSDYMLRCQGCHLPDGSGFPGKVPSLANLGRFLTVEGGREFLVQVPGTSQSVLTDQQTADVLNWILRNFSKDKLPDEFIAYTGAEVSTLRKQHLDDVSATRAELVARLHK